MALSSFSIPNNNTYLINHQVDYPEIVCVEQDDSFTITLATHPISGQQYISALTLASDNSTYVNTWANAVNVAYDATYDQITGMLYTPGPEVNGEDTYITRNFCMSLQGTPNSRSHHLHVYVGPSLGGGGGDPDDGSWTGDTP